MLSLSVLDLSILLIASYLCGSIPFGLLICRLNSAQDLRHHGSGNIGATNAWRVGGKKVGILTFVCDMSKAFIPSAIFQYTFGTTAATLSGLVAVLGHIYPLWLKFKGGKGVAPMFGFLLAANSYIFCCSAIVWMLVFRTWRISSLASLAAVITAFLVAAISQNSATTLLYLSLLILIFYTHRTNLARIIKKEEKPIA